MIHNTLIELHKGRSSTVWKTSSQGCQCYFFLGGDITNQCKNGNDKFPFSEEHTMHII